MQGKQTTPYSKPKDILFFSKSFFRKQYQVLTKYWGGGYLGKEVLVMKTFSRISIALILMLVAVSCTQYRFFPFPLPDEDDSTPYDVSTSESFEEMLSTRGQVRLTSSISVSDLPINENRNYSINLNGNTLTLNAADTNGRLVIAKGSYVTINGNGGTLDISIPTEMNDSTAFIKLQQDSSLTLNNVTYNSARTGILVDQNAAKLNINNSTIIAYGGYAVGTNASTAVEGVNITINGSRLIANNGTGLLFNIPSTLSIIDSHIEGGAQALIVRGGNATIKNNSELVSNGNVDASDFTQYANGNWKDGNSVPYATLVVGNATENSYEYNTTCSVDDSTSIVMKTPNHPRVYVASTSNYHVNLSISKEIEQDIKDGDYLGNNISINGNPISGN